MASNEPPNGQDDDEGEKKYTISQVEVKFPMKPYKVQMYALVKIVSTLKATTNALLELPTGSGKTLALLCGTLAWQKYEEAEILKLIQEEIEKSLLAEGKESTLVQGKESTLQEKESTVVQEKESTVVQENESTVVQEKESTVQQNLSKHILEQSMESGIGRSVCYDMDQPSCSNVETRQNKSIDRGTNRSMCVGLELNQAEIDRYQRDEDNYSEQIEEQCKTVQMNNARRIQRVENKAVEEYKKRKNINEDKRNIRHKKTLTGRLEKKVSCVDCCAEAKKELHKAGNVSHSEEKTDEARCVENARTVENDEECLPSRFNDGKMYQMSFVDGKLTLIEIADESERREINRLYEQVMMEDLRDDEKLCYERSRKCQEENDRRIREEEEKERKTSRCNETLEEPIVINLSDDENAGDFVTKPKQHVQIADNPKKDGKNLTPKTKMLSNNKEKQMRHKEFISTQREENSRTVTSQQSTYTRVELDSDDDLEDFCVRPKKITRKEDNMKTISQGSPLRQSQNMRSSSQRTVTSASQQPSCSGTLPQFYEGPGTSTQKTQEPPTPSTQSASRQFLESQLSGPKPRVPKIFYCSRTHAQLKQVVKELEKTIYKDVNMTILSSREYTCIQNCDSARSKTELCRTLLDPIEGRGCIYERNVSRMSSHSALQGTGLLETPWDIEDLVTAGRKLKACPYFAARELVASSDIVFCPYIYLIDPKISSTMKLDISGAVIILDEAHNIEECCREAASYSVSCRELEEAAKDCERVAGLNILPELHNKLARFIANILEWVSNRIKQPYVLTRYNDNKTENVFNGVEATVNLEKYNITLQDISEFKNLAQEAMVETNREENKVMMRRRVERYGIVPTTSFVLTGLYYVLGFMYDNNMRHIKDYFVTISKNPVLNGIAMRDLPEEYGIPEGNELRFGNRQFDHSWYRNRNYFINFLCMNSAVIFRPISEKARTILLASGTLSPLETYASELGAAFPHPVSTSHIIDKKQVFVAAVSKGPKGKEIISNYQQSQKCEFKDELGSTILEICKCIPYGVLCFLPSYALLKNLESRWIETEFWSKLEEHKVVMCEPQNSKEYSAVVQAFQDSVKLSEQGVGNGPLLFAVMRGKVSEGMNFADNMARAVISVGIPYPHLLNIGVILKRHYNSTFCRDQKLSSGEDWYRIQAYRAINQALGRCIRHSKDWGALILIDQRFVSTEPYIAGLAKWLNENVRMFNNYQHFEKQLKSFVKIHTTANTEENNRS